MTKYVTKREAIKSALYALDNIATKHLRSSNKFVLRNKLLFDLIKSQPRRMRIAMYAVLIDEDTYWDIGYDEYLYTPYEDDEEAINRILSHWDDAAKVMRHHGGRFPFSFDGNSRLVFYR